MKKNAFSRVLALVLALVMVIGNAAMFVVADDDHDHDSTTTATHPAEDEHSLSNPLIVKYHQVGDPVQATCLPGYTLYQCDDCKCYFADNFVDSLGEAGHDWNVTDEATCTTDGSKTCNNCGETRDIEATGHKWDKDDKDCTVIKTCTVCDATSTGDHTWSKTPEIIKVPTHDVDGEAKYTCVDCGTEKIVKVIYGNHLPGDHTYEYYTEKSATCTEPGNRFYQYCDGCETYWLWSEKDDWYEVDKEDTVIPALGHEYKLLADEANVIKKIYDNEAHTCKADVFCARCGDHDAHAIIDIPHTNAPNPTSNGRVQATCDTWGYDQLFGCLYCGYQTMVNAVEPYGHVDPETHKDYSDYDVALSLGIVTIDKPTCKKDGLATWSCQLCGKGFEKTLDKLGTNAITVNVPATCNQYAYTYQYCDNDNCDCCEPTNYFTVKGKDGKDYTVYLVRYEKGEKIPVFVHLVPDSYTVDFDGGFDPDNHVSGKNWYFGIINEPTCEKEGDRAWYCEYCTSDIGNYESIPKLHHYTFEEAKKEEYHTYEDFWSNGVEGHRRYREWYCPNGCGWNYEEVDLPHNFDANYAGNIKVDASCITDGYYIYVCKDCGDWEYDDNYEPIRHVFAEKTDATMFHTLEDAQKAHGNLSPVEGGDYKVDDCETQMNFKLYRCDVCGRSVAIITNQGAHTKPEYFDANKNEFEGKAPTCTEDGYTDQYWCLICNKLIESEVIPALGHTTTCGKCDRCHGVFGHDWEITDEREWKHDPKTGEFIFGYIHETCSKCHEEVVYNYYRWNTPEWHKKNDVPAVDNTCITDGLTAGVQCDCGFWHVEQKVVDASAAMHVNKDGVYFYYDCDVEDRHCVTCGKDYDPHVDVQITHFQPTCLVREYDLKKCRLCGHEEKVWNIDEEYDPDKYHDDVQIGHTNATYHEPETWTFKCNLCKRERVEEGKILEGIGYFLDVDNAVVSGAGYSDSSLIAVTVRLDANKVNAWGFQFDVKYDKSVMTLESYKFVSDVFLRGTTANATVNTAGEDVVRVIAYTANDADGNAQNFCIDADHNVVVLYFRVDCEIVDYDRLPDEAAHTVTSSLKVQDIKTIAETVVDDEKKNVDVLSRYGFGRSDKNDVTIDKFLDIDEDGRVNIADVKYTLDIISGASDAEYDVVVDVDKDGEITFADLEYIIDYIAGIKSYDELTAAGVPTAA